MRFPRLLGALLRLRLHDRSALGMGVVELIGVLRRHSCAGFEKMRGWRNEWAIWLRLRVVWSCLVEAGLRLRLGLTEWLALNVARVVLLEPTLRCLFVVQFLSTFTWRLKLHLRVGMIFKVDEWIIRGRILEAKSALETILTLNRVDWGCLRSRSTVPFLSNHRGLINVVLCLSALLVDKEGGWWKTWLWPFCKIDQFRTW